MRYASGTKPLAFRLAQGSSHGVLRVDDVGTWQSPAVPTVEVRWHVCVLARVVGDLFLLLLSPLLFLLVKVVHPRSTPIRDRHVQLREPGQVL